MKLQLMKSVRRLPLLATVAATLVVASAAHAESASGKLVLAGFVDAADGDQLMAGQYAAVIEKLTQYSPSFDQDEVAVSTNLCVAYVASHQLAQAHGACDEAIKMARLARLDQTGEPLARLDQPDALSIAYANRAVLSKLSGE
jgi:hypothetical protein